MVVTVVALYQATLPPTRPDALTYAPLVFEPPVVESLQLPNGITLYLREDHELPLVEITALVGAGSITDAADKTGQSTLFAALLRDGGAGSRDPVTFSDYLEKYAIDLSVSTDSYATVIDLSLLADDLDVGLNILDDLLRRPRFDADRLEILRQQMLESIRRQNDLPASIADRGLDQAVFGDHPFGRTPTVASINALSRADLMAFQERYFVPDNLCLAISGAFNREDLITRLQQHFANWSSNGFRAEAIPPLLPSLPAAVWLANKEVPQTTVRLGALGISKDNPDLQAVRLMNFILGGGGFNSRLMSEIRSSRGLAYSVYSYYAIGRRLPGPFVAGGETATGSTLEMVRLILAEMERIRTEPVSAEELALAKESLINSFVFAFDDPHDVLTQKMRLDFYGYPSDYLESYRDKVAAVTTADVLRVAKAYLNPQQMAIVLVGATDEFAAGAADFGLPVQWLSPSGHEGAP
jgi:zinc protease